MATVAAQLNSMRAAVLTTVGQLTLSDVPIPTDTDAALVRVTQAGICGSDRAFLSGSVPVPLPRILGHEIVGVVERAGWRGDPPAGTRVQVDPSIGCGRCRSCRSSRPHLCPSGLLIGRDTDGGLAEFVAVAEDHLYPIPDTVTDDQAAVLQVLSTCVHSLDVAGFEPPGAAVVIGLGVTGLLHAQLLLAGGADPVFGVDPDPHKRHVAADIGCVVSAPEDAAATALGLDASLVVETAGTSTTFAQAVAWSAPGATLIAFGLGPGKDIPAYTMYLKELTVRYPRASRPADLAHAISVADRVVTAPMVSARYGLDDVVRAFDATTAPGVLKVVVTP